jgi:hypothetical protein
MKNVSAYKLMFHNGADKCAAAAAAAAAAATG